VDATDDWSALIVSLRLALERFSFQEANLRNSKKTDWPSYGASRCRSVRQFEELYLCISVRAVNDAELFYEASCQPRGESDITLHVTLNRYGQDSEICRLLRRLFKESVRWATEVIPGE
jgi:hypothetical protein